MSDRIYLDYWWYLPDNPANTAQGAMCGAGLVIAGVRDELLHRGRALRGRGADGF